jgi:4a-hydroxytetrahydrobiopterin dehydratase
MAELLDRDSIDAALAALPGWSYDGEALARRVEVPADTHAALEQSVGTVADAMDHHPTITREGDALVFRLWTHSEDGVTAKDVELAARIDQTLSGSGSDSGSTA